MVPGGVSKKDGLRAFNQSLLSGSVELIKQKPERFQSHFVANKNKYGSNKDGLSLSTIWMHTVMKHTL